MRKNPRSNEGGLKKNIQEKNIFNIFLEKLIRATQKNIGQISGKVNESEELFFKR